MRNDEEKSWRIPADMVTDEEKKRTRLPVLGNPKRKPKTLKLHRETKADGLVQELLYPERGFWRPSNRSQCEQVERPCPYVGCRHNLYVDHGRGDASLIFNFPGTEPWDVEPTSSCALDIVERSPSGMTLEDIGRVLGITRERVRQIEARALEVATKRIPKEERENALASLVRIAQDSDHNWDHVG